MGRRRRKRGVGWPSCRQSFSSSMMGVFGTPDSVKLARLTRSWRPGWLMNTICVRICYAMELVDFTSVVGDSEALFCELVA